MDAADSASLCKSGLSEASLVSSGTSGESGGSLLLPGAVGLAVAGGETGVGAVSLLVVVGLHVLVGLSSGESAATLLVPGSSLLESGLTSSGLVPECASVSVANAVVSDADSAQTGVHETGTNTGAHESGCNSASDETHSSETGCDSGSVTNTSESDTSDTSDTAETSDAAETADTTQEATPAFDLVTGEGHAGNGGQNSDSQELHVDSESWGATGASEYQEKLTSVRMCGSSSARPRLYILFHIGKKKRTPLPFRLAITASYKQQGTPPLSSVPQKPFPLTTPTPHSPV